MFWFISPRIPVEKQYLGNPGSTLFFHSGYGNKGALYDTHVYLYCDQGQRNPTIYQAHLDYGRDIGWSETYIQLHHHHQQFIRNFERKSGSYIEN